jgi:hypothetical protein
MATREDEKRDIGRDVCIHCGLIRDGHNIHGDCPPIPRGTRFERLPGPTTKQREE